MLPLLALAVLAVSSQALALANSLSFDPPTTVAVFGPNNSVSVDKGVQGDFNGDGHLDLLVVKQFGFLRPGDQIARVLVLLGDGDGGTSTVLPESQPANSKNVWSVETGDLNGDGRLDVVLVNSETHNVTVLLGNGNGTFADQTYGAGMTGPRYQAIGDLDGDGRLDIVVGNWGGALAALINNGAGAFGAPPVIISGHLPGNPSRTDIEIGDVNGDGANDVVSSRVNGVDVYLNNGFPVFAGSQAFDTPTGQILLKDFDGDGLLDIATPSGTGDAVRMHSGDGNGNFGAPAIHPTGATGSFSIAAADFNGDGILDIATPNTSPAGSASVLQADGSGSFAPAVRFPDPATLILPHRLLVGDVNNDGKPDLLTLNKNSGPNPPYATVMLNTAVFGPPPATPPVITSPGDITAEATSADGTAVTFTATANDDVDGPVNVTANPPSGSTFPLGTTTVSLTATDAAGNTATGSFTITVQDTTPPVILADTTTAAEATSSDGAAVSFVAIANDIVSGIVPVTAIPPSGSTFPLGLSLVSLYATDAAGNTASGSILIKVQDTTAPVISSLTASSATLWPPNHKMVSITLTPVTSDAVGVASLKIIGATSSEPDNGLGDGDAAGDIEITGALTLNLRAERSGAGNGRIYTITVEAKDAAGNASTRTVTVSVPKSQGK
ncbi:MAG: VCBS repeat-containing protein [Verrucomicrobia bacterium]|nr:VCBS repeat-containing protein [Verrucomicrobiota bacterium]